MAVDHINDLRAYVQVVDSGSLAAAARVLDVAPTLVSRRLARLEAALGVRLLQRTTRRLHVSDEGRTFYARCRRILADLDAAEVEIRPGPDEVAGIVRVVLPSSMVAYGILDSLRVLLEAHPGLIVRLRLFDHPVSLVGGGWDVATHIGPPADSSHVARRIGQISPCMGATAEYLAREGIPEHPIDLSRHACVRFLWDSPQTHWPITDVDGNTHRVPVGGQLECHDILTMFNAMCAGYGIGILPRAALRRAVADGVLMEVLPGCRLDAATLYALMPAGRNRLPRVRLFVDWLADFMDTLEGD